MSFAIVRRTLNLDFPPKYAHFGMTPTQQLVCVTWSTDRDSATLFARVKDAEPLLPSGEFGWRYHVEGVSG